MKGYLLLANGQLYEGTLMGAAKPVMAELVFTTAMTGYLETLTDPSYEGEIVIQTFPTIGNYGVIPEDFESPRPRLSAYIVRELCDEPSNFRCQGKLDDYLKAQGIPCLTGVDTRALTRVIRNAGVMNAALLTEKPENPEEICAQLKVLPFHPSIQDVTCDGVQPAKKRGIHNVVLWDFGAKANIQRELEKRGCAVTVVPASATAQEILNLNPDGLMLSNGPGDPADNTAVIANLRELMRHLRHLPGASAAGAQSGRKDRQAEVRPPRRKSAREGRQDRAVLHDEPEPRLCGGLRHAAGKRVPAFCQRQRRHL